MRAQYNGCKWLGGVLRVEPAKPDYKVRLAREAAEGMEHEDDASDGAAKAPDLPLSSGPIHLPTKDARKVSLHLALMVLFANEAPACPVSSVAAYGRCAAS